MNEKCNVKCQVACPVIGFQLVHTCSNTRYICLLAVKNVDKAQKREKQTHNASVLIKISKTCPKQTECEEPIASIEKRKTKVKEYLQIVNRLNKQAIRFYWHLELRQFCSKCHC